MNCCEACFQGHADPLRSLPNTTATIANCDLCGNEGVDTWHATELFDAFSGLLGHYEEIESGTEGAAPVSAQLQRDWAIFSFDDPQRISAFLNAVFSGDNEVVREDRAIRLRRPDSSDHRDHVDAWDRLAADLKHGNRFFPSADQNREFLERIVDLHKKPVAAGVTYFRARVCDDDKGFAAEKMGMPPSRKATAGRANPLGIPHLYMASDEDTCIQESRATQHNFVTVAKFKVVEPLLVAKLDEFTNLDPFEIEDDAGRQLDAARTIERLGEELRKPVRPTDDEVEYVPTQYLAGLLRTLNYDGIIYSSSVRPGGTNIVLFSDEKVEVLPDPATHVVTGMTLETSPVAHSQ